MRQTVLIRDHYFLGWFPSPITGNIAAGYSAPSDGFPLLSAHSSYPSVFLHEMATSPNSDNLPSFNSNNGDTPDTSSDIGGGDLPPALRNIRQIVANSMPGNGNFADSLITPSLAGMSATSLENLVLRLISTLTDTVFRSKLLRILRRYIREHPYVVAFSVVGLILLLNPIALAGFGALGPIAGKY